MRRFLAVLCLAALMAVGFSTFAIAADLVSEDETYFLRRDDCGGDADHLHLATRAGQDSEGCAYVAGVANEAGLELSYDFPQEDALTYVLDTAGTVRGTIATTDFFGLGATAGLMTVEVKVTGSEGLFNSATLVDEVYENVPVAGNNPSFDFEADIDDALAGMEIGNLKVSVIIRGVQANHTIAMSGDSFIEFDHLVEAP